MVVGFGVFCFALWLVLSGYFDNALLLGFGVLSVLLVVLIAYRMRLFDADNPSLPFIVRALLYVPWLGKEIIVANIDVSKRILDPKLPISPTLFRVKASQRSDLGKVVYANSITLTPGTISVYVDDISDEIEVHALSRDAAQGLQQGEMDRRVTALEEQH